MRIKISDSTAVLVGVILCLVGIILILLGSGGGVSFGIAAQSGYSVFGVVFLIFGGLLLYTGSKD